MAGLTDGVPPDYNEWDALFYLTWYQPRQINLTHLVASHVFAKGPQPIHVIDIGCGASVSQFAFAIAYASLNVPVSEMWIDIHGIDTSDAMKRLGDAMWAEFVALVDDPHLAAVCEAMVGTSYDSYDAYSRSPDPHEPGVHPSPNCYLLAIHAIYQSNKDELRRTFSTARAERDPAETIISCAASRQSIATHAAGDGFAVMPMSRELLWSGQLTRLTRWRTTLMEARLPFSPPGHIIRNFLSSVVYWRPTWNDAHVLIRSRGADIPRGTS